jgi:hypothetical protein
MLVQLGAESENAKAKHVSALRVRAFGCDCLGRILSPASCILESEVTRRSNHGGQRTGLLSRPRVATPKCSNPQSTEIPRHSRRCYCAEMQQERRLAKRTDTRTDTKLRPCCKGNAVTRPVGFLDEVQVFLDLEVTAERLQDSPPHCGREFRVERRLSGVACGRSNVAKSEMSVQLEVCDEEIGRVGARDHAG